MISGRVAGTIQTLLVSLGLAFLVTLPAWILLVPSSNLELYHLRLPATKPIEALLLDIFCAFLLVAGLLYLANRLSPTIQLIVWGCVSVLGLWLLVSALAGRAMQEYTELFGNLTTSCANAIGFWQRSRKMILILGVAATLASAIFAPRWVRVFCRLSSFGMAAFGLTCLWLFPHLNSLAHAGTVQERSLNSEVSLAGQTVPHQRIIWILLDELSYDQTFDHPAPGIHLPNLHRFRAESVAFTDLRPAGYLTDRIIPSLFLGRPIDEIRSTRQGLLEYEGGDDRRWQAFDPEATLFGMARRSGWTTGIAGLYNPLLQNPWFAT